MRVLGLCFIRSLTTSLSQYVVFEIAIGYAIFIPFHIPWGIIFTDYIPARTA